MRFLRLTAIVVALAASLAAQDKAAVAATAGMDQYRLGPGDEVRVFVFNLDELGAGTGDPSSAPTYRVDENGKLVLPVVGTVMAGGLSVEDLSKAIATACKKYLRDPQVSVQIKTFKSRPVSVFGAVKTPGVFQLEGGKSIVEVLALAGGLADNAGSVVKITRHADQGPIALPGAELQGEFYVATARLGDILGGAGATSSVSVRPYDVITVPNSPLVYVLGSLKKPGGFMLKERTSISVLQAVAAAEGLEKDAAPAKARLLRPVPDSDTKTTVELDVKAILQGKLPDMTLQPGDVLYIPSQSSWKSNLGRMSMWIGGSVSSAAIYRF